MKHSFRNWLAMAGVLMAGFAAASGWSQTGEHSATVQRLSKKAPESTAAKTDWNAPLPSESEMKQRVLANWKKSKAEQERYVCKTTNEIDETDKHGNVKKRHAREYDMFFVNGQEIDEQTSKDGKPFDTNQRKKEMERVQKQIKKDSDMQYVAKKEAENEKQADTILRMLRYTHGHRIDVHGRPTLAYDLSGDSNVHPKGMEETVLHAMTGTIQVDEATGELVDLNARLDHNVKIGGGLFANLHKGFWVHVRQQRYPDGVWLVDLAEANGDARAALFFHPYFKFKQTMNGCALTNVTTSQGPVAVAGAPDAAPKPPK